MSVISRIEPLVIPTYPVGKPEKNPVFFEKRVYQGSCGKVYPVPFIDKVFDQAHDVSYQSARLENEFVRLVMLPEIGGRIFLGQDKINDNYDFFYRQDVIKPALVGLAGPWISGGVEFNWPQHHRPGTFLPTDILIEEESDGSRTVWMSEHDPLDRLKGMHGIRLRPGSSLIELRARLYNRTPMTRSFLWWANIAAMVHDDYQSFFPADVHYVADHAVRAMSSFPQAGNPYYGVHYENRPDANRLDWYKNIPVPTSYMVCQTGFNFFGGYDHRAGGGFVHIADRHISPGKKQWTWGKHEFGYAWDRELTDHNGPYIELMGGVYTDNQPDFSYLLPYETKVFSQFWWPIQGIGPVQQANKEAALHLSIRDDRSLELGLNVSSPFAGELTITQAEKTIARFPIILKPGEVWQDGASKFTGESPAELLAELRNATGEIILSYRPPNPSALTRERKLATEPPAPEDITSVDELYLNGEHLELNRHPTREPEIYWNEALARDPGDLRCNLAVARRLLQRGLFNQAAEHFKTAVTRLTHRHPNPVTGEAHYYLGLTRVFQNRQQDAYDAFAKAAWNYEWRSASYYQLACLDCQVRNFSAALVHLDQSLATNRDHNKAKVLTATILRRQGHPDEAQKILGELLALDPLDHWARAESSLLDKDTLATFLELCRNDAQTILDLVFDYADAGITSEAIALLELHQSQEVTPTSVPNPAERTPMTCYALAWLSRDSPDTGAILAKARAQSPDHFFPSRLHEQIVLEWALAQDGPDPVAAYALGNYYYNLKRHEDAIAVWEVSKSQIPTIPQVHRNLGIGYWNARRDAIRARSEYESALAIDPTDPRLVSEFDQLRAKLNDPLEERLAFLESHRDLVFQRDDASVSLATLYNLLDQPDKALELLVSRRFHPWEGGEGAVLRQYTTARLLLGRRALDHGDPSAALDHFMQAMDTPDSLGEKYHLLQAKADVNYWLGRALSTLGRESDARDHFESSASEAGDFSAMAETEHSPLSYFRGLSLRALGREDEALAVFNALKSFGKSGLKESASIDYFATSLPDLLVFDENLQARRDAENQLLIALADHGLGNSGGAKKRLHQVMSFTRDDPHAHYLAGELA